MATAENKTQEASIIKLKNKNVTLKIMQILILTFGLGPLV